MQEMGIVPKGTALPPINPWPAGEVIPEADQVLPWDKLSDDQKRLFARMAENYAGFSSYTDHELGHLLDYLEETNQLDNTLILVMSDNGASGEGGPNGSVNENKFFNGWPDDLKENLAKIDLLGGPETYPHYPAGWAQAFNTPYKMFKRYSLEGGVADPLILSWPKEMKKVAGGVRDQYHHCIDLVPTILDCCGVEAPAAIKGHTQTPIQGVSMRYSFGDAKADSKRETQYYAMLGTRAIYHKGWKAVARHGAISGKGKFMEDKWELYNIETDRSESNDVSAQFPEKKLELIATWFAVAGANNVFPLDDRTAIEQLTVERPEPAEARDNYTYYANTSEIPEGVAPNIRNRSFGILATCNVSDPKTAQGVLMTQGGVAGGHTLFLKDGKLNYVYNFLGIEEQKVVSSDFVPKGDVILGIKFNKEKENPKGCANGTATLYVNDTEVGKATIRTQPGKFALAGEGLVIGRMGADSVTKECKGSFTAKGATVKSVTINVSGDHYRNLEAEALAMLSRE